MNTQIFDSLDWQDEDELHKVFNYSTRAIFSFFLKKKHTKQYFNELSMYSNKSVRKDKPA